MSSQNDRWEIHRIVNEIDEVVWMVKYVKQYRVRTKELMEIEMRGRIVYNGLDEFSDAIYEVIVEPFAETAIVYVVTESVGEDEWEVVEVMI